MAVTKIFRMMMKTLSSLKRKSSGTDGNQSSAEIIVDGQTVIGSQLS
jgi:hypothetical protein